MLLKLIAEATTQPQGVVSQFFDGLIKLIGALGGIAGITGLVLAYLNRGAIKKTDATATAAAVTSQNIATRGEQIAAKVTEVTRNNPAIEDLPPPPSPLVVTPADVTAAQETDADVSPTSPRV